MRVVNHADLSPEVLAEIERELSNHENLKSVMKWAVSHPKGVFTQRIVEQVILQDEFTHDVVIPWREGLVLVYDTT